MMVTAVALTAIFVMNFLRVSAQTKLKPTKTEYKPEIKWANRIPPVSNCPPVPPTTFEVPVVMQMGFCLIVILSFCQFLYFLYKIYKQYRSNNNFGTKCYITIVSCDMTYVIKVPLFKLPFVLEDYKIIPATSMPEISIKDNYCFSYLRIDWKDLTYDSKKSEVQIEFPRTVPITLYQKIRINRIIDMNDYEIHINIKSHGERTSYKAWDEPDNTPPSIVICSECSEKRESDTYYNTSARSFPPSSMPPPPPRSSTKPAANHTRNDLNSLEYVTHSQMASMQT